MRIFLIILFGFVLGGAFTAMSMPVFAQEAAENMPVDEAPFDNSTLREDNQIIAFVGRKVFVREDENYPIFQKTNHKNESGEDDYVLVGSRYEVRFEILDLISGEYENKTIDFYTYTYNRAPRASEYKTALIFIEDGPKIRENSLFEMEVHRTTDGDWAACGDAYYQYDPEEEDKEPLEPISFLEPVTVNLSSLFWTVTDNLEEGDVINDAERAELQADIDEENKETNRLFQPPIWKREGPIATCQLGTRVRDLYAFQYQTWILPEKREEICEMRTETPFEVLEEDLEAKRQFIDDCTDLLEIQNLP